jgi:methyl-accepting chemotaxis protein
MKLRAKLTIAVAVAFVATIIALIVTVYVSSRRAIGDVIDENQVTIARDNAVNVETWLQGKLVAIDAGAKELAKYSDHVKSREQILGTAKLIHAVGNFLKVYPSYEDGTSIYSDNWQPTADFDPRKRPWYIKAKAEMKAGVTDPFVSASTGQLNVTFYSPLVSDGKFIGVVGSGVLLDDIIKKVLSVKIGKTGYAYILDKEGKILVHPKSEYVMKKKIQELVPGLGNIQTILAASPSGHTEYTLNDEVKIMSFAQIPSTGWYLCVTVNEAEVFGPVTKQTTALIIIGTVFLVIGLVALVIFIKVLLNPLGIFCERVADLAEGEGDLTKRIDIGERSDEIGVLANKLNKFIGNMHDIVSQITVASHSLAQESQHLNTTSSGISHGAEKVAAQAITVATASEEMAATASDIANNCHTAANSAKFAADMTQSGFKVVTNTVDGIRQRGEATRVTAQAISSLGERSEQIGAIVSTIEDIADQTNLLALNAAIEAARAGEMGRGFAVVADEVRALAERTTKATNEISDMIKSIQSETKSAIVAMDESVKDTVRGVEEAAQIEEALRSILDQVDTVTAQVNQIATAAEEQTATTTEITNNIQHMTTVVQDTARGSHDASTTAYQLSGLADELKAIVNKFRL